MRDSTKSLCRSLVSERERWQEDKRERETRGRERGKGEVVGRAGVGGRGGGMDGRRESFVKKLNSMTGGRREVK